MTPLELLSIAARVFEELEVPYAVTGSMASTRYGEMRTTNDVDIVADLRPEQVEAFLHQFPASDFYVSENAVRSAIVHRGQFNIIHPTTGLKIDVIIPRDEPHDRLQLQHARRLTYLPDQQAMFVTPEDVILKKLWFYNMTPSDRHLRDIASIMKVRRDALDRRYIEEWAERLNVAELWREVVRQVERKQQ